MEERSWRTIQTSMCMLAQMCEGYCTYTFCCITALNIMLLYRLPASLLLTVRHKCQLVALLLILFGEEKSEMYQLEKESIATVIHSL